MNTPKHSFISEQPSRHEHTAAPHGATSDHERIVPQYMRERVLLALGQRMVKEAVDHRSIDLTTHKPQETIFPDFDSLDQAPQTD